MPTRRLGLERPILWAYVPQAEVLIDALDPSLVVYHCVDDIAAQERIDTASFRAAETRFAARADLVLASAPALAERLRTISGNVMYAPNVADTELFSRALMPSPPAPLDTEMAALPTPRIVFTGAIVATEAGPPPAGRAGPPAAGVVVCAGRPDRSGRTKHRHISTDSRAEHPSARAPLLRRAARRPASGRRRADPLRAQPLTESIFPMKVYEYLAAGLPVVATPLPALADVAEVATAPDAQGIAELLDEALADGQP